MSWFLIPFITEVFNWMQLETFSFSSDFLNMIQGEGGDDREGPGMGKVVTRGSDYKENLWGFLTGVDISELFLVMTFQVYIYVIFFFFSNFIVIQVQFSAFSSHLSLTPNPPHLPPVSTTPPHPLLLSMCPL